MSDKKIKVPEGMQLAFVQAMQDRFGSVPGGTAVGLEAALRWLAESPIVPNDTLRKALCEVVYKNAQETTGATVCAIVEEFQRRMFLAEPEVPEEIADLIRGREDDDLILEAYKRGKASK